MRNLKIFFVSIVTIFINFSYASTGKETPLDWSFKYEHRNHPAGQANFRFTKASIARDKLRFEIIAHNPSKDIYQCILITASEKSQHMDDEFGNEYVGATASFSKNLDNKLAPNQRKAITLSIPKPDSDVVLVNLHFGLYARNIESNQKCEEPFKIDTFNYHQFDWDTSSLQ